MFPPSRAPLFDWIRAGHLSPAQLAAAERALGRPPAPAAWYWLFDRLLLWLAVACLGAGIVFFVAFNWHSLGRLSRLLLVCAPLLASLLFYWRRPLAPPAEEATLLFIGLNLGALLALIGQTYQTGADPYQLFALWALLLIPWAWLARSPTLWTLSWLLAQVALIRYWQTGLLSFFLSFDKEMLGWLLTLGNGALWAVLVWIPKPWGPPLPPMLPALACGMGATLLVQLSLFNLISPLAWPVWLLWLGAGYLSWHGRFLTGLALGALSVICVILTAIARHMDPDMAGFLLLTLLAIGLSVVAVRWLAKEKESMHG